MVELLCHAAVSVAPAITDFHVHWELGIASFYSIRFEAESLSVRKPSPYVATLNPGAQRTHQSCANSPNNSKALRDDQQGLSSEIIPLPILNGTAFHRGVVKLGHIGSGRCCKEKLSPIQSYANGRREELLSPLQPMAFVYNQCIGIG